jgi:hypothetical protein
MAVVTAAVIPTTMYTYKALFYGKSLQAILIDGVSGVGKLALVKGLVQNPLARQK